MSAGRDESSDLRAVRLLAEEAAREPAPDLDWARVEQRLSRAIDERAESPRRTFVGWTVAAAGLAAAAAVALALHGRAAPNAAPSAPTVARVLTPAAAGLPDDRPIVLNGDALAAGDAVEAAAAPLTVDNAARASWTLAPGSRAEVAAIAKGPEGAITLRLVRGSVHAEVVHRDRPETFAVEIDRTRVAVHGTSFTVTRSGDRALVEVAHGAVAVGAAGHPGATQGYLLTDGQRGSFSLDGGRDVVWLSPHVEAPPAAPLLVAGAGQSDEATTPAAQPSPVATPIATAQAPGKPAAPLPATLTEPDYRPGLGMILGEVARCYERQTASSGVHFSVATSITLSIRPDGSVSGLFDPPLSPTLMGCATDAVARVRFPRALGPTHVRAPVRLGN